MDPGYFDTEVSVVYRNEVVGDIGSKLTKRECKGCFWAMVNYITKSLVYSGNEKVRPKAIWPTPIVRFTFQLDYEFDFKVVEFHLGKDIYKPRDPGVRIGGPRGSLIVYNCSRVVPGEKIHPGEGSGS